MTKTLITTVGDVLYVSNWTMPLLVPQGPVLPLQIILLLARSPHPQEPFLMVFPPQIVLPTLLPLPQPPRLLSQTRLCTLYNDTKVLLNPLNKPLRSSVL